MKAYFSHKQNPNNWNIDCKVIKFPFNIEKVLRFFLKIKCFFGFHKYVYRLWFLNKPSFSMCRWCMHPETQYGERILDEMIIESVLKTVKV